MALLPLNARIVYEGDSITAGSNGPSWIWAAIPTGAHKAYHPVGYNQAVGGQTAAQMAAQIGDVMALNPHVVVLFAGTNDLAGTPATPQEIFGHLQTCRNGYIAGGALKVVVVKVLPRNGDSALNTEREANRVTLNTLIDGLARVDTVIVDVNSQFDPSIHANDGLHPNGHGSQIIGQAIGPVIGALFEEGKITSKFNDPDALLVTLNENPQFLGSAGASPTGWTFEQNTEAEGGGVGCTVTQSKEDNGDGTFKHVFHVVGTNVTAGRIVNFRNMVPLNAQIGEAYDYALDFELMPGHKGLAMFSVSSTGMSSPSASNNSNIGGGLGISGTMRAAQTAVQTSVQASYNIQNLARVAVSDDIDFTIKISQPYVRQSIPEPALVWPTDPDPDPTDPDPDPDPTPDPEPDPMPTPVNSRNVNTRLRGRIEVRIDEDYDQETVAWASVTGNEGVRIVGLLTEGTASFQVVRLVGGESYPVLDDDGDEITFTGSFEKLVNVRRGDIVGVEITGSEATQARVLITGPVSLH